MSDILQLAIIELRESTRCPRAADAAVEQLKMLRIPARPSEGRVGWTVLPDGCSPRPRSVRAPTSASPSPSSFGVRATRRPKPSRAVSSARWESSGSAWTGTDQDKALYLFEPVILLADLDQGQVQSVTRFEAPLELPALSLGRPRLAASWWRGQRAAGRPVHDARRAQGPLRSPCRTSTRSRSRPGRRRARSLSIQRARKRTRRDSRSSCSALAAEPDPA